MVFDTNIAKNDFEIFIQKLSISKNVMAEKGKKKYTYYPIFTFRELSMNENFIGLRNLYIFIK